MAHVLNRRGFQSVSSLKVACMTLHQLESKAIAKLYMTLSGVCYSIYLYASV
jgi:hypothetical protein